MCSLWCASGAHLGKEACFGDDVLCVFSLRLPAHKVAATIVRGLKAGDFCITFGVEGYLVGLGTAGFAPCFSVTQAVCQVRRRMRQIEQSRPEQCVKVEASYILR